MWNNFYKRMSIFLPKLRLNIAHCKKKKGITNFYTEVNSIFHFISVYLNLEVRFRFGENQILIPICTRAF